MNDSDRFTKLVGACLQGTLANPELKFTANHSPVPQAMRLAKQAMEEIDEAYPHTTDRHTETERLQRQYAREAEKTNGNGYHRGK